MSGNQESGPTRRGALGLMASAGAGLAAGCAQGQDGPETDGQPGFNTGDIAGAEKLAGVEYTPAEREQMLAGMEDWVARAERLRAFEKPNALAPATVFDPRLPGQTYNMASGGTTGLPAEAGNLPASAADIAFAPVWKQAGWMAAGAITSLELTEIYLSRIDAHDSQLEAFVTVMADHAREQAVARDQERANAQLRGPLHGIPYTLKDIVDVSGVRATWGAEVYKDRVAEQTATIASRLEDAGAVLLGKTTNGAIAYGDIWFGGVTRNPFNPNEGSSGSSAGPASATAAGLCAFSIGTETMGSIVSPSHRCGTSGLRPTFGRVSRHGAMALCWSLDKIGPIVRHVADASLVMDAINGFDVQDAGSIDTSFGANLAMDVSGLRLGYDPEAFENGSDGDRAALEIARTLGVTMVEIKPELDLPWDGMYITLEAEAAAAFEHLTLDNLDDRLRWQDDNAWPNTFRRARFNSAVDMINADRLRRRAMEMMHAKFTEVDAMIGPNFANAMLLLTNYTGHPQLVFRSGFSDQQSRTIYGTPLDETGETFSVPHASSLWAPLFKEDTILALGHAIETGLGVADQRPPQFT